MAEKGFKRKLTAILSADVEGYSRLMGDDEEATIRTLTVYREVFFTLIQQHNGKVLDSPGDNLLAEFVSVVDAVQCAVAVQKEIKPATKNYPKTGGCSFVSASTSVMLFRKRIEYMVMVLISLQGWKGWLNQEASASPRPPLIILKVSCPMDMSF
jgi:hypothetical protein